MKIILTLLSTLILVIGGTNVMSPASNPSAAIGVSNSCYSMPENNSSLNLEQSGSQENGAQPGESMIGYIEKGNPEAREDIFVYPPCIKVERTFWFDKCERDTKSSQKSFHGNYEAKNLQRKDCCGHQLWQIIQR